MQLILINGFTGIEKKNTLFSVGNELGSRGKKVVVVVTEHMEDEAGDPVMPAPEVVVREMISSCVPCSFIFDLMNELQNINSRGAYDHMVIEIPFSSLPAEIKEGLSNLDFTDMSFAPIIHVFDVRNLESEARLIPKIVSNQIIESEAIFINADVIDQEKVLALKATLGEMNPDAIIFEHSENVEGHTFSDLVGMIMG